MDGLGKLESLAGRVTMDLADGPSKDVPIVFVPGFSGWGSPLFGAVNYWGGIENIPQILAKAGHTVILAPVGPLSSNWERACELYAQLRSSRFTQYNLETNEIEGKPEVIDVDYGDVFPIRHRYEREPQEWRNWKWDENSPAHFICHSQGGTTVRYLLHLMEHCTENSKQTLPHPEYFDTPRRSKWAISVPTVGTPHRGTTVVDALWNLSRHLDLPEQTRLLGRLFAVLSFEDQHRRTYDLQLDHWGIKRGTRRNRNETFSEMRERLESSIWQANPGPVRRWIESNHNALYDNSVMGVNELNEKTIPTSNDVYYFSLSFSCVEPFPPDWPSWTLEAIQEFPLTITRFLEELPIIGNIDKMIQGALNFIPFLGDFYSEIHNLSFGLATQIAQGIIGVATNVGGWHIVSNLVDIREATRWLVDKVLNRFIQEVGYNVRVPPPGDYLPIASVLPLMFPTAYAISSQQLSNGQRQILRDESEDWKVNDGIVNTASMKGPLNRNGDIPANRDRSLIVDACDFPRLPEQVANARGKYWHFGTTDGMDHADKIGIWIESDTGKKVASMYTHLVTIVSHLSAKPTLTDLPNVDISALPRFTGDITPDLSAKVIADKLAIYDGRGSVMVEDFI
ncbi:Alpha/Beta hydrolase protein [Microdochium trichocladiopsis]|uniref:Alpha/Beta hydrolase protein n=1 Tax=Microdochium trichocladiopsis TaxID=1682393 RepID=A0A9P8Y5Y5_9PEZI|nr:Alpha/Beta hydrolase protein [Microdochium trichocladiopsis]KAH7029930.1 Alpha/Beta hydrolase protein [Microdochium trichocladiopsis]